MTHIAISHIDDSMRVHTTTLTLSRALSLLLLLVLWFGFLELRGLYFPDEGRYAEIPREMLASGDWVTPRLNGFPYFEKPPLQYWVTAGIFSVAGEDEWTARLGPAIAGFLAVIAVWATARHLYSRRAGWMAAALLGGSCGYFLANQFVTLDVTLTALLTAALCAFLIAQDDATAAGSRRRWMYSAWIMCGLAFLAKGAIAIVLPAIAITVYMLVARDWRLLGRLYLGAGLLLVAVVAVPWLVAAELRNPGFLHFFFVREHWERFTQPSHQRTGPLWYFIPIGAVFLMPWLPALLRIRPWRDCPRSNALGFNPVRFAWYWAAAVVLFFSLSSSKLPPYILPALAGVALAAAPALARHWRHTVRISAWTIVASGIVGAVVIIPAARWIKVEALRDTYVAHVGWMLAGMSTFVVAGALALLLLRQRRRVPALASLVLGGMLGCQLTAITAHRIDAYFSAEGLIETISGGEALRPFRADVPFYMVNMFDHTVPYYLGRTVILVKERGEVAWGIERAPANFIPEISAFLYRWNEERDAYAIMPLATFAEFTVGGVPMREVARDGRRIVVTRH